MSPTEAGGLLLQRSGAPLRSPKLSGRCSHCSMSFANTIAVYRGVSRRGDRQERRSPAVEDAPQGRSLHQAIIEDAAATSHHSPRMRGRPRTANTKHHSPHRHWRVR